LEKHWNRRADLQKWVAQLQDREATFHKGAGAACRLAPVAETHYGDFEGNRVKHLEMIQAVVARLASNSFLIKGWAVTVSGAFLGFAIGNKEWALAVAGLLPILLFWWLDGYFLRAERMFRDLHDAVRATHTIEPFYMAATSKALGLAEKSKAGWNSVLFSLTLVGFYGALVIAAGVVAVVIAA
jgi:hypothetical protein